MLKTVHRLHIFVETMINDFKEKNSYYLEIYILLPVYVHVFTVTLDWFKINLLIS